MISHLKFSKTRAVRAGGLGAGRPNCHRLLASIHDVGPRFGSEVEELRDRLARALPLERVALLVLTRSSTARVGGHPADTTVPALLASIDRAVGRLSRSHRRARYSDLEVGGAACAS
jgi:hypothetical protein